jgi:hypothetical protein
VSGTVSVREEDKLTMSYELTDEKYEIERESSGFLSGVNKWRKNTFSKNKETIEIPLSDSLDGTSLKRSNFIKVSEK